MKTCSPVTQSTRKVMNIQLQDWTTILMQLLVHGATGLQEQSKQRNVKLVHRQKDSIKSNNYSTMNFCAVSHKHITNHMFFDRDICEQGLCLKEMLHCVIVYLQCTAIK